MTDHQGDEKAQFRFGKGNSVSSSSIVHLPVEWRGMKFSLKLHVIDENIPFPIGIEAINKIVKILDFENNNMRIGEQWEPMHRTKTGHLVWNQLKLQWQFEDASINDIFAIVDWTDEKDLINKLQKLHTKLGHASEHKMQKMLEKFPPLKGRPQWKKQLHDVLSERPFVTSTRVNKENRNCRH